MIEPADEGGTWVQFSDGSWAQLGADGWPDEIATTCDARPVNSLLGHFIAEDYGSDFAAIETSDRIISPHASGRSIEVIVARDPDGPLDIHVLVDGIEQSAAIFVVDAGAGWTWDDWCAVRDDALRAASPNARRVLLRHYGDPPGGDYITGRGEEDWLDPPQLRTRHTALKDDLREGIDRVE
ncbi:hypothetical protein [Nocardia cyriacigeorgica]|uniref:hypothetical protein n=1 Tax=Nocardia cyriacigeorgica TaxID=135487 RepID=UPI002457C7ED|nr:hypothetical protein [Nocardia cyriacigeorgica]BDU07797.1 hypothetical protein FMUBM48_40600 [Nocardia cyriacigeorgica]